MALSAWKDHYRSNNIQICQSMSKDRSSIFLPDEKKAKNMSAGRVFVSVSLKSSIVVLLLYLRESHPPRHISPPRGAGISIESNC